MELWKNVLAIASIGFIGKTTVVCQFSFEQTLAAAFLKDCVGFKTFWGATYNQINDVNEPDVSKMRLNLYKENGREAFNLTNIENTLLLSPKYNCQLPLTVFIYGFLATIDLPMVKDISSALVIKGGTNVLVLDTDDLMQSNYLLSSTYTRFIGEELGTALGKLSKAGVPKFHLIGHSFGAQVASMAGKSFYAETGKIIDRITGLDPSGPCFHDESAKMKLSSLDAEFVDVVHTDVGVLGIKDSVGHVDFYPNNGGNQPGCFFIPCNHDRSLDYYKESILSATAFPALNCTGWSSFTEGKCSNEAKSYMGYGVDLSTRGIYYLRTSGSSPFGKGDDGITVTINPLMSFWNTIIGALTG